MKLEFTDLGPCVVKRTTQKAALVAFEDEALGQEWIPFSVLATTTAAVCEEGAELDRFRVEAWFAEKIG